MGVKEVDFVEERNFVDRKQTEIVNYRFRNYAWGVLSYNLLVILWGAYVRATGSGAGCGRHWPTCNGTVIPREPELETIIEFTHRVTSALAGILVIVLLIWAFRAYVKGHPVRKSSVVSLVFILTEGAVGAGLVLLELVAQNDSVARAYWMAAHLANTFLLLGALTLTAWWATTVAPTVTDAGLRLRERGRELWLLAVALLLIMIVSAAGAVTALGDTLFPAGSLAEGVARDFSATAHFLERLRVWHPLLAIVSAIYIFTMLGLVMQGHASPAVKRFSRLVQLLVAGQVAAGFVNLLLLAPVWMQLVHLLLADGVWMSLVLLAAAVVAEEVPATALESAPAARPAASQGTD